MQVLQSGAHRIVGDELLARTQHHTALAAKLQERLATVRRGGGAKAHAKQRKRGKLLVRERIDVLCDPGTPWLELAPLAAWDMYEGRVPGAGLVTGIGQVAGELCMIVANDPSVKAGTYYPETVKKHLRAQDVAAANALPCIYLVDSGGAFLPLQAEVFPDRDHFGRIFYNQARMSAAGIPQIAVVLGMCTAGGAYVPAMADENIMVQGGGTIYLGGPPLVKAATGEEVTAEELGGAEMHARVSGVCDRRCHTEQEALQACRDAMVHMTPRRSAVERTHEVEEPLYPAEELRQVVPHDVREPYDVHEVIMRLVDGSRFQAFKPEYGTTLVCGFAHWYGYSVGIVANNGVLFGESAQKGAHFVQLCNQRRIPLIFLQNITGFMVGRRYEEGGITKHGAKMVQAVATATVPKLTVVIGASHGAGNYAMCGRGYDPRFLFLWPNARVSVMGGAQAAHVLTQVKEDSYRAAGQELSDAERAQIADPVLAKYAVESDPYYGSARLWDDGIIQPEQTRAVIGLALEVCLRCPGETQAAPVFRM